jgi:hypothetical protein
LASPLELTVRYAVFKGCCLVQNGVNFDIGLHLPIGESTRLVAPRYRGIVWGHCCPFAERTFNLEYIVARKRMHRELDRRRIPLERRVRNLTLRDCVSVRNEIDALTFVTGRVGRNEIVVELNV